MHVGVQRRVHESVHTLTRWRVPEATNTDRQKLETGVRREKTTPRLRRESTDSERRRPTRPRNTQRARGRRSEATRVANDTNMQKLEAATQDKQQGAGRGGLEECLGRIKTGQTAAPITATAETETSRCIRLLRAGAGSAAVVCGRVRDQRLSYAGRWGISGCCMRAGVNSGYSGH